MNNGMWPQRISLVCLVLVTFLSKCALANEKRPFYIIGHMVNSIRQVRHYLDRGCNSLESDIQFYSHGSVKEVYHGFPCDCFRTCHQSANLEEYLKYVRRITDPRNENSYYEKFLVQMLDLKMSSSRNKTQSGRDLARHVLDFLWSDEGDRKHEIRVVLYLEDTSNRAVVQGFVDVFRERGVERRLKDVGFDAGQGNLYDIRNMFSEVGIQHNIWQGEGKTNCISALYPDGRLRRALQIRNTKSGFMSKVYHWTIDLKFRMRASLTLGVDGMITNDPEDLNEVLRESYYSKDYRLATVEDDPFEKYEVHR